MEKEVTLSFNAEELLELAKQLTLARVMVTKDYENELLVIKLLQTVCAVGHAEFNEHGDYEHSILEEHLFRLSVENDDECVWPLVEAFQDTTIIDHISDSLGSRDFWEKNKGITMDDLANNADLDAEYKGFVEGYKWELMLNDVYNLRLVPEKDKESKR